MELQVVAQKENPLLKRVEVTFKAVHKAEPTPTRDAIRSELAKLLKASKDVVVVDRSVSSFGRYETLGYAKVYKSKEEALSVERSHILVRNKLKEAEVKEKKEGAKAEKPAPAAKPAAKAEPKPEAPKAEAKPEPKAEAKPEHKEEKPAAKPEKKGAEKHEEKKEAKPEAKKAEPKKKEAK
jgi:small subunit ribosomal protein S24e